MSTSLTLPLNQIAFSVIDLKMNVRWWHEGLGFLPAGDNCLLMRGPLMAAIQGVTGAAATCWCLHGRNDWALVGMFQYEKAMSKLIAADAKPNDIGYTESMRNKLVTVGSIYAIMIVSLALFMPMGWI